MKRSSLILPLLAVALLQGCSSPPVKPSAHDNICKIFDDNSDWKKASQASYKKWGTPPWTQLAFVHQESRFKPDARPPMEYFLFIPTGRASTARGFSQALDGTWSDYMRSTGNYGADRDDIHDSLDFIGWHNYQAYKRAGVSRRDAKSLYLSYHEGVGGFKRKTYKKKAWLNSVANKVRDRAVRYMRQYKGCS